MFDTLTDKFSDLFRSISGRGKISEENIRDAMKNVRTALLEADVNFQVVKDFCENVIQKAIGSEVIKSLRPDELMVKIVHDELAALMGPVDSNLYYVSPGPTVIMLAGLQGSGKTTTCGKLAKYLINSDKKPLLTAVDLQRPAAIEQLKTLGRQLDVPVYSREDTKDAVAVCREAVQFARNNNRDVVILDTAGRLHIDTELMTELGNICKAVNPHQIFLVCDAMTGQDAVNSAKEFNDQLELDGVILTKLDGDARGGAALSVKSVTGKPIKFMGTGEKLEALEEFHPERMAGRILGMGDIVGLVNKAQEQFDEEETQKLQEKMAKGTFTFDDFLKQMSAMKNMGGLKNIMKLIPGMGQAMKGIDIDENHIRRIEAMIMSMTKAERNDPDIITPSRRRRIASGSGSEQNAVAGLIKTFKQSRQMMQLFSGTGPMGKLKALAGLGGGMGGNMDELLGSLGSFGGGLPGKTGNLAGPSGVNRNRKKVDRKKRPNKVKKH